MVFYDDLFEYVRDADVTNYEWTLYEREDKELVAVEFELLEDVNLLVGETIERNGRRYVNVDWGEHEESYVPKRELRTRTFWTLARWVDRNTIKSYGNIYENLDEALRVAERRYNAPENRVLIYYVDEYH